MQLLLGLGILMLAIGAAQAQSIRRITAPGKFYVDDKQSAGIVYNYAVYSISNSTATNISSAYVVMTNMVATNLITLAANDSGVRSLGALAPGQTKLAAFYLKGPGFTGNSDTLLNVTNETHTIRIYDGLPGIGATLVSSNFSFTNIIYVIEALANKVTIITNLNPQAALGSEVDLVIGGETGTIGGGNAVSFSPGVLGSWRPDAYELIAIKVYFADNGSFTNQMYFDPSISGFTNFSGQTYTNTFRFRAMKVTGTSVPVSPFAFVDSGAGTKHTAVSTLTSSGGSNVIYSVTNTMTILSQSVTPTSLLAPGGTVTYAITFTNHSSNTSLDLNEIRNTLPGFPGNVAYIPGSATWNAAPLADPSISGQLLRWAVPLTINSNSIGTLVFQGAAPLPAGAYTNSVTGLLGNEQIDTTISTTDNSPSLSAFIVIPVCDVALAKSAPASVYSGTPFTYIITVTNLGPSPLTSLSVTDSLPANVTFVSATPAAFTNGNLVIWTNLGPIAASSTSNLTLTVMPPTVAATLTNSASGGSPNQDLNSTNNTTPPVFTTVIPLADLSITKSASSSNPPPGQNFPYAILVTNLGPSTANSVVVTDSLPANLTFVSASNGGVLSGSNVIWSALGNLAAGSSLSLNLTVTAPLIGSISNSATVGSSTLDTNSLNNVTPPVVSVVTNQPPTPVNDTASTPRNMPVSVPVLANDSDANGDALTLLAVTQTNGTATIVGTNVLYTPLTNFTGTTVLTYTVTDGRGATNTALITILVTGASPIAVNDIVSMNEDATNSIPVLVNDSDPDGDPLTLVSVTTTNGTASIVGTNVVYTPSANFTGTNILTYCITDSFVTNCATITVVVSPVNDAPAANNLSVTINEDTSTNMVVTASDVDSTNLTFSLLTGPSNGSLGTLNTNTGAVTYSPTNNYSGPDSFTFTVFDGSLYATGTVSITVTPLNDPPVAVNDNVTVNEDSTNSIPVLVNDSDPDGNPLTIVSVSTNATIVGTNIVFTPAPNFSGTNVLTYCITDGFATNCATITVIILAINDAPIANSQSVTNNEDIAIPITLTGSDVDGPVTNFVLVSLPLHGALTGSGANLIYTPTNNYNGPDSFTFTVNDGSLTSLVATVSITVLPVNDAPVAVNDSATTPEDTQVSIPLLLNDSDPEGNPLSIQLITFTNGTVTVSGTNLLYTPSTNFFGTNVITYTITDGVSNATASIFVTVLPVNDAPSAVNDAYSTFKNVPLNIATPGVLMNDTDVETNALTALLATNVTHGTLLLNANGSFTYTPSNNYVGPDSFAYYATDGSLSNLALVSLTISATNTAPVAVNDSYSVNEDTVLNVLVTGGVLTNDTDADFDSLTATLVATTTNGILSLSANGSFTYTPNTNFVGVDIFTYRANDGFTNSGLATVTITVNSVNDAPFATNLSITMPEDSSTNLVVRGSDVESTNLVFAILTSPSNGSLGTLNTNSGAVTYTPTNNYVGPDSFTFTVFDGALYATGTVSITVTPLNDPPIAVNDNVTVNEDSTNSIPVLVNDSDPDGNPLTIVSVSTNATIVGTNVVFTPAPNFSGTNFITYCITDGFATNCATITAIVLAVNDAPVALNDSATTQQNTPLTVAASGVLGNDTDAETNALTAVLVSNPANGTLTLLTNGGFTYTPTNDFTGTDTFTYVANDGLSNSAVATVSILVTPLADVAVTKTGPTNITAGASFSYVITVTNFGPSAASNVVVVDNLPTNLTFVSATGGGTNFGFTATWPTMVSLAKNAGTNFTIVVIAPTNGSFINVAYATSTTADPNPSNNDGSASASRVSTLVAPAAGFGIRAGTNVFNPQTGLYEQTVIVTNTTGSTASAIRLLVWNFTSTNGASRTNVSLWNAHGVAGDGRSFVQYNSGVNPGATVTFRLEYYNPTRVPFTNSLEAQVVLPTPANTNLSGGVLIDKAFQDNRPGDPRFVIEWASIIGRNYTVIYGPTVNGPWTAATPTVTATSTRTQWYDDGPPKTASEPLTGSRFYRVILNPINN